MAERIHVEEEALMRLKQALDTAGDEYCTNYAKLTSLIQQITNGDFEGDPAETFKTKYEEKETVLRNINSTIVEASRYVEEQTKKFVNMLGELKAGMK